jgi:hypothetical protein
MRNAHAKEMAMQQLMDIRPISLKARGVHRIANGRGLRITCFKGPVWVTQQGDERDIILAAGQSFVLDRKGAALVYALKDAAIHVGEAGLITVAAEAEAARARAA